MKKTKTKTTKKTKEQGVTFTKEQYETILEGFFDQMNDRVLDLVFNDTEECHVLIDDMMSFIAQKVVNESEFPISAQDLKTKVAEIMNTDGDGMAQSLLYSQVEYMSQHPDECCGMCDECKSKAKAELATSAFGTHNDFTKTRGLN
jgi:hypothetical protein